jgi:hypothetical protein
MGLLSKDKRAKRKADRKERREDRRTDRAGDQGTRVKQFLLNPSPYKNPKQNKNK